MKKTEMWLKKAKEGLTKTEPGKTKQEQSQKIIEQMLTNAYKKGIKEGQGKTNINPFKIKKEEVFIDPNDPDRPIEEQKRLRRNWNQKRRYHKRKEKENLANQLFEKLVMQKEAKLRAKQKLAQEQNPEQDKSKSNY
ncbi:unnamed protein product [marine sediment metagenome]|uniref:Uncharacterized protein n=1 Tax=marine sediment metagenome TaxID=412755 RepID=X1G8F6_9ZZZZ